MISFLGDPSNYNKNQPDFYKTGSDMESIIFVNRSIIPSYPIWFDGLEYPELETNGPSRYDLSDLGMLWPLEPEQVNMTGIAVHEYMIRHNQMSGCTNLQDAEAIHAKGPKIYEKYFGQRRSWFLASIARADNGIMYLPTLCPADEEGFVIVWRKLRDVLKANDTVLRFTRGSS